MNAPKCITVRTVAATCACAALAFALTGCAPQQETSSSASSASTSTSATSDSSGATSAFSSETMILSSSEANSSSEELISSSEMQLPDGQKTVTLDLEYNAGTGYTWQYEIAPEDTLEVVSEGDLDMGSEGEAIAGGPLIHSITLKAKKPGTASVTCQLVREFEQGMEPANIQTYVFEIDENLGITLNRDASDFTDAPSAGMEAAV